MSNIVNHNENQVEVIIIVTWLYIHSFYAEGIQDTGTIINPRVIRRDFKH